LLLTEGTRTKGSFPLGVASFVGFKSGASLLCSFFFPVLLADFVQTISTKKAYLLRESFRLLSFITPSTLFVLCVVPSFGLLALTGRQRRGTDQQDNNE
jgi:hypothetical protein